MTARLQEFYESLPSPTEHWELLEAIGEGTYGGVFRVRNLETGEYAAAKRKWGEIGEGVRGRDEYHAVNKYFCHFFSMKSFPKLDLSHTGPPYCNVVGPVMEKFH